MKKNQIQIKKKKKKKKWEHSHTFYTFLYLILQYQYESVHNTLSFLLFGPGLPILSTELLSSLSG